MSLFRYNLVISIQNVKKHTYNHPLFTHLNPIYGTLATNDFVIPERSVIVERAIKDNKTAIQFYQRFDEKRDNSVGMLGIS